MGKYANKQYSVSGEEIKFLLMEGHKLGIAGAPTSTALPPGNPEPVLPFPPNGLANKNSIVLPLPPLPTKPASSSSSSASQSHTALLDKIQNVVTRPPYGKAQYS